LIFRAVEDGDLIRQAARGNVEAFNLLVSRWEKRVYNYLLRLTANREDALDLTQDVFLKAYQNLRKLDDAARFAPWLYRIAHNEAYSMFRKRRPESDVADLPPAATETGIAVGGSPVFPIELSLAVASALERLNARTARGRHAEDLPGVQIRGNGRDSLLPGFHHQKPIVYGAGTAEDRAGSD
jgi:RNA polymerase sigma-70 factor, ECF subfamily